MGGKNMSVNIEEGVYRGVLRKFVPQRHFPGSQTLVGGEKKCNNHLKKCGYLRRTFLQVLLLSNLHHANSKNEAFWSGAPPLLRYEIASLHLRYKRKFCWGKGGACLLLRRNVYVAQLFQMKRYFMFWEEGGGGNSFV